MAYQLTQDFYYSLADIYDGAAQRISFSFDAPPVGPAWYAAQLVWDLEDKVRDQGENILRLRVWEDHQPILVTGFVVEFTITSSPLAFWAIALIITACLAVLGIIIYQILKIVDIHWPEISKAAKWISIGVASVAMATIVGLLTRALPKREVKA